MALTLTKESPARLYPGGSLRTYQGSNPAAGTVTFSESVPAGKVWYLLAFSVVLVTDANVANRVPTLQADTGVLTDSIWRSGPAAAQTASLTWTHAWGVFDVNVSQASSDLADMNPIPPDFPIPAAYRLTVTTLAGQAGDDYAAPLIHVVEFND